MNAIINLTRGTLSSLYDAIEGCDGALCENVSMVALFAVNAYIIFHAVSSIG